MLDTLSSGNSVVMTPELGLLCHVSMPTRADDIALLVRIGRESAIDSRRSNTIPLPLNLNPVQRISAVRLLVGTCDVDQTCGKPRASPICMIDEIFDDQQGWFSMNRKEGTRFRAATIVTRGSLEMPRRSQSYLTRDDDGYQNRVNRVLSTPFLLE